MAKAKRANNNLQNTKHIVIMCTHATLNQVMVATRP